MLTEKTPAKTYKYHDARVTLSGWEGDFLREFCKRTGQKKATLIRRLLKDAIRGRVVKPDGTNYFQFQDK